MATTTTTRAKSDTIPGSERLHALLADVDRYAGVLGWPVTTAGEAVFLDLGSGVEAVAVPLPLAGAVRLRVLCAGRGCPVLVLGGQAVFLFSTGEDSVSAELPSWATHLRAPALLPLPSASPGAATGHWLHAPTRLDRQLPPRSAVFEAVAPLA
ncbi:hypothetical protein ACTG9Q_27630 [Actinokineospora sp. 24-640]